MPRKEKGTHFHLQHQNAINKCTNGIKMGRKRKYFGPKETNKDTYPYWQTVIPVFA